MRTRRRLLALTAAGLGSFVPPLAAQPRAEATSGAPALATLRRAIESGDADAPSAFWARVAREGSPLVEPSGAPDTSLVTFLVRGGADVHGARVESNLVAVAASRVGEPLDSLGAMMRLPGTDVWYLTLRLPDDARAPYRFIVTRGDAGGDTAPAGELDPLNRRVFAERVPGTRASILELPGAPPQPWRRTTARGRWAKLAVRGRGDAEARPAWVYTPAECADARQPCGIVVALGSGTFAEAIPIDRIIDHLVEVGRMRPALVAAIDVEEGSERRAYEPTADWVADALLPWLRERFNVSGRREHVVVAGASRRGLVATSVAFRRNDAVGAAIAMSGSFYWSPPGAREPEWLPRLVAGAPPRDVRLVLAVGSFETVVTETNRGHYPLATTRHMRDVLLARDYDVRYAEFSGVHSELNWQDALADGLAQLLPADPAREETSRRR